MATTIIQLTTEDSSELIVALDMIGSMLDTEHGDGFYATTPFLAIRAKFPRNDDIFGRRPTQIDLTDIQLGALKALFQWNRWLEGGTTNSPIYDKLLRAIEKRASTVLGRLSLSRAQRRAEATGYFGLTALGRRLAQP